MILLFSVVASTLETGKTASQFKKMVTEKIKEVGSDQLTDKTRKRNLIVFGSTSIQISSSMQPVWYRSIVTGRFSDICPSRIELPFSRSKAESGAKWAHFSLRRPAT